MLQRVATLNEIKSNLQIKMKRQTKSERTQTDDKVEQTAAQPKPSAPTPEQIRWRAQEIFEARE